MSFGIMNVVEGLDLKISYISYNTYLKQPETLSLTDGRWLSHTYDGSGAIIKTEYSNGEIWTFSGGVVHKNDRLSKQLYFSNLPGF